MKPNGFVAAASTTSQTLMPSLSHIMRQLVDHADVHGAKRVLQQLHHLRHFGRADFHHGIDGRRYKRRGQLRAVGSQASHHLRHVLGGPLFVARIDALGRKGEEEIAPGLQSRRSENRLDDFLGRARVRGRFEDDEHARDEGGPRSSRPPPRQMTSPDPSSCAAASARRC